MDISCLTSQSSVAPVVAAQLTLRQRCTGYAGYTLVYTDASSTKHGSSSVFTAPSLNHHQLFRLGHRTSSTASHFMVFFQREDTSAQHALERSGSFAQIGEHHFALINAWRPNATIASRILKTLTFAAELNYTILFLWVPGHCGVQGNLDADHLESLGHQNVVLDLIPLSKTDAGCILGNTCRATCRDL